MVAPGTVPVRIEVLPSPTAPAPVTRVAAAPPPPPPPAPAPRVAPAPPLVPPPPRDLPTTAFTVEVASLASPDKAEHLRRVLSSRFPEAFVSPLAGSAGPSYRVRIGPYPLRAVALARAELVNRLGYPAVIVQEEP